MRTDDFNYELPPELIAQKPIEPRDTSRLLVINRQNGLIEHHHFSDILNFIHTGDVMVFNDSRVIPARFIFINFSTEFLLPQSFINNTPWLSNKTFKTDSSKEIPEVAKQTLTFKSLLNQEIMLFRNLLGLRAS